MKRLCTICARGGSKGVPGKNIRLLQGRPLIAHSVEQAVATGLFDAVAVSSDSSEILTAARAAGATMLIDRPPELATDTAAKLPVIRHAVSAIEDRLGYSVATCVDLDATSPLRSVEDIRAVVVLLESSQAPNVITAMPARRSPYFNLIEIDAAGRVGLSKPPTVPLARRQDAPQCFDMNASIYGWRRQALFDQPSLFVPETKLYVMPEERSIDIDSEIDFLFVDFIMSRRVTGVSL